MTNPRTLAAYENGLDRYLSSLALQPVAAARRHLEAFAAELPAGAHVLEVGSGPGQDADRLEALGLRVRRTDAAWSFVHRLRARGHEADVLNLLTDPLGGPYDGAWASAVLLHLTRTELADALVRLRAALRPGGVFGFSVKEGDGAAWSTAKLADPRYFVYWRAEPLAEVLDRTGWQLTQLSSFQGRTERWLTVRCTA